MDELPNAPHPHTAHWFSINRSEIVAFGNDVILQIQAGKRHIAIKAPVKSGKREIVEYISARSKQLGMKNSMFYNTALNRKDVKSQKEELEKYKINTHCISGEKQCYDAIEAIELSDSSISCIDECDYGSGKRQKMAPLFNKFIDIVPHVFLYFSATIEETSVSAIKNRPDFHQMEFIPPPTYRGAKWFLDNGLVFPPSSFFEKDDGGNISFTEHAFNVIRECVTPDRNVCVVRVSGGIRTSSFHPDVVKNDLQNKLNLRIPGEKPWEIVVGDEKYIIEWENNRIAKSYTILKDNRVVIVISQTCTRGTDLKYWHAGLAFWHDSRKAEKSNANTLAQAFLRVAHYGEEGHHIRLYADERLIRYVIDDDFDEYSKSGGKAPTRTKKFELLVDGVRTTTLVSTPASMYGSNLDRAVHQKGSTHIIKFEITDEEKSTFESDNMLNILRNHNEDAYIKYKSYEPHCWNIDTDSKCEKYGLNAMIKKDAYSSETNIRDKDKTKNVLMIYLHENTLIFSAWNGEETKTSLGREPVANCGGGKADI
jgi:hypothetical protein